MAATVKALPLWRDEVQVRRLMRNVRAEDPAWANFVLSVGNGRVETITDGKYTDLMCVPERLCLRPQRNSAASMQHIARYCIYLIILPPRETVCSEFIKFRFCDFSTLGSL